MGSTPHFCTHRCNAQYVQRASRQFTLGRLAFPWRTPYPWSIMAMSRARVRAEMLAARLKSPLLGRPGFLLRRLHQLHCALFLEETRAFGITPVQYSLMTALRESGELDQNSLALQIGLERTSVAEVVPRLQARGLVQRLKDSRDGRVKLVRLTAKGRMLLKKIAPAAQRAHDRTIEKLNMAERELFVLQMVRLVEANNEVGAAPLRLP